VFRDAEALFIGLGLLHRGRKWSGGIGVIVSRLGSRDVEHLHDCFDLDWTVEG
jgi:hypothetical protein